MGVKLGYKRTDVGVIPEDWRVEGLGAICDISAGGDLVKDDFSPASDHRHKFPIYSNAVSGNGLYGYSKAYQYEPNQITVTARGDVGTAVYRNNRFCAIGRLLILSPKLDCDLRYVTECINNSVRFALESTGVPQLTAPQISKYLIALPPTKAEQEAIAEALSDADTLIESLAQTIAKKRQIRLGTLQKLLRPKDGWVNKRLGDTAGVKARIGWQGLTTSEYLESGDYYLVTGTEFKDGSVAWNDCHFIDEIRYKQDKNIQLRQHDVLVTKDGTIGKVALIKHLDRPATLNSGVFVIRPFDNAFYPGFFYYLLCSTAFANFLGQLSAGSTINHLYQKDIVNFIYQTPPTLDEQVAVADILSAMDTEIVALESKLEKARQVRQGMMQNLLTGRIRLI